MLGIIQIEKRCMSRLLSLALVLMITVVSVSCKKTESSSQENQTATQAQKSPAEILAGYKPEIYGDREIFLTPRLQFLWSPKGIDKECLWTIKLDGSDLRLVAGLDLLYQHATSADYAVRSPDNRYVVFNGGCVDDEDTCKVLVDLKDRTSKVIAKGLSRPNFQWTNDSKTIVFYLDTDTMEYNVEKGELKTRSMIYSQGFYILPKNNQILEIHREGYSYNHYDGKLIKEISLGEKIRDSHSISPDGKYLFYNPALGDSRSVLINTERPKAPLFTDKDIAAFSIVSPDAKSLFYIGGMTIFRFDIQTKEAEYLASFSGERVSSLSIINYHGDEGTK